jgi:hypothetical protein
MVYFIQKKNRLGPIKIGKSVNPKNRIIHLQTGSDERLNLLGFISEDIISEKELHDKFSRYKIHGEWFYFSEALINFIEENTAVPLFIFNNVSCPRSIKQLAEYDAKRLTEKKQC